MVFFSPISIPIKPNHSLYLSWTWYFHWRELLNAWTWVCVISFFLYFSSISEVEPGGGYLNESVTFCWGGPPLKFLSNCQLLFFRLCNFLLILHKLRKLVSIVIRAQTCLKISREVLFVIQSHFNQRSLLAASIGGLSGFWSLLKFAAWTRNDFSGFYMNYN